MTSPTESMPSEQQPGVQQTLDAVIAAKAAIKQWEAHLDVMLQQLDSLYEQGLVSSKAPSSDGKKELVRCAGKTSWTYSEATVALATQLKAATQYEQTVGIAKGTPGKSYWQVKDVKQPSEA